MLKIVLFCCTSLVAVAADEKYRRPFLKEDPQEPTTLSQSKKESEHSIYSAMNKNTENSHVLTDPTAIQHDGRVSHSAEGQAEI
jgi:hypothetical protein